MPAANLQPPEISLVIVPIAEEIMRAALTFILSCVMLTSCFGQSPSEKWQVATIMNIKAHMPAAGEETPAVRYYVTVRVESTEYVVLYVPPDPNLKDIIGYHPGKDGMVLVGTDTLKYNDILGRTREVPIISRRAISTNSAEKKLDKKVGD